MRAGGVHLVVTGGRRCMAHVLSGVVGASLVHWVVRLWAMLR
ncbi:hypothetical protein [Peterkaempfera bronchialis]|nr:hypothetical protein [Peterkaempfera bronchialis]